VGRGGEPSWPHMLWLPAAEIQRRRRERRTPGNELCRWDEGDGGAKCGGWCEGVAAGARVPPWSRLTLPPRGRGGRKRGLSVNLTPEGTFWQLSRTKGSLGLRFLAGAKVFAGSGSLLVGSLPSCDHQEARRVKRHLERVTARSARNDIGQAVPPDS
jgi:hypothetical protein